MSHEEDLVPSSGGSKESPAFGHTPFSPLRSLASRRPGYVTNRCTFAFPMYSFYVNFISEWTIQAAAARKIRNGIDGAWLGWLYNRAAFGGITRFDV